MGAISPINGTIAQSSVTVEHRGMSTSLSQFFRSLGGVVGVSILGVLMNVKLVELQERYLGETTRTSLTNLLNNRINTIEVRSLFNHALSNVFLLACVFV